MKGSSKVMIGATLSVVMILAIVLCLVLFLLAELYCSLLLLLLLRRRKLIKTPKSPEDLPISQPQPSPLSSFYSQGVLEAPRSFLFPKLPSRREKTEHSNSQKQIHGKLHQFLRVQTALQVGLTSPKHVPEIQVEADGSFDGDGDCSERCKTTFMYISNPIYDNDMAVGPTRVMKIGSSPSGLDGEEPGLSTSSPCSLPLSPINQMLPPNPKAKAPCVALTAVSDSTSHFGKSSSSSDTPHTSPSW